GKSVIPLGHAARNLEIDDTVAQPRARNKITHQRLPACPVDIDLDAYGRQAALQAPQVAIHPERLAAVRGHHLINAIAVYKATVKYRNPRIAQTNEFAIQVNDTVVIDIGNHFLSTPRRKNGRLTRPASQSLQHQA